MLRTMLSGRQGFGRQDFADLAPLLLFAPDATIPRRRGVIVRKVDFRILRTFVIP
jgi:hypothetical protein